MSSARVWAFIWVFIFFLIHNTLLFVFPLPVPSLVLITVIFYGLYEGPLFGLALGIAAGFLLDLFGAGRMGAEMMLYGAIGWLCGNTAKNIFRESTLTQFFLAAFGAYFLILGNTLIFKGGFDRETAGFHLIREAFLPIPIFATAVASPYFFRYFRKVSFVRSERRLF